MKKQNKKVLGLKKRTISSLSLGDIKGGTNATTDSDATVSISTSVSQSSPNCSITIITITTATTTDPTTGTF